MADRPDHLLVAVLVVFVGALVALVASLSALLGRPALLAPGMLAWPGFHLPLTVAAFVGSLLGLAAVPGLLAYKPWAPKLAAGLTLAAMLAGIVGMFLLAPLKGFVYPWPEALTWTAVLLAGTWLIAFCTDPDVLARYAEEEAFPSTTRAGETRGGAGERESAEQAD